MKLITIIMSSLLLAFSSFAFADLSEKADAAALNVKGTAQDTAGALTGDSELQAKGKLNKAKSKLKSTKENIKDNVKDAID